MEKFKALVTLLLVAAVTIFALQNAAVVEIRFLLWSFSTPRVLLVVALLGIGIILGLFINSVARFKQPKGRP